MIATDINSLHRLTNILRSNKNKNSRIPDLFCFDTIQQKFKFHLEIQIHFVSGDLLSRDSNPAYWRFKPCLAQIKTLLSRDSNPA